MTRRSTDLVCPAVAALRIIDEWGARTAAAGVTRAGAEIGVHGPRDAVLRWASVTKLLTGLALLVAVEEGTVELAEPAGPPGSTLRHLLSHASGLAPEEGQPLMPPAQRRIYSNYGVELAAALVAERSGMPFADYFHAAVVEPLALTGDLHGSAAWGYRGTLDDLLKLGRELLAPTLVARETLDEATSVQFPGLAGVLPGFGRMEPNDWGLTFELRDHKSPHWTSPSNSARTFGHFGAAGTFLWVDPELGVACALLTDKEFGPWAVDAWPRFNESVVGEQRT
jgi:CubicO group peptidase (beta-lactamase class C family)